jgi:hypothetical protein
MFLFPGFNISVTSVVILDFVGLEYLTEALGLASLFGGIGSVLGPPFSGSLCYHVIFFFANCKYGT